MTSLTDLRSTLDEHAETVGDTETIARLSAVHHRVAAVRRRRAAGTGVVALALVAVAAVAWPRGDQEPAPAGPVVLGQHAPATMSSLGYTYRTDGHAKSFTRAGSIKVTSSSKPQLFTWTTDGATKVRVTTPEGDVLHSTKTRFRDFVVLAPGDRGDLKVHVDDGRVGVASYELTGPAPAGYTKNGITFRETVAGTSLLTAAISDPGQRELSTSYLAPAGAVQDHLVCGGLKKGQVLAVSFSGKGRDWAEPQNCDARGTTFDVGSAGYGEFRSGEPATTVRVRAFVTNRVGGTRVLPADQVGDVWFGIGVYGPVSETSVGGWKVADQEEAYGHTWSLTTTQNSSGRAIVMPAADHDQLATTVSSSTSRFSRVSFSAGSSESGIENATGAGGRSASPGLWVPAGARVRVTMDRGTGTFGIALYDRSD